VKKTPNVDFVYFDAGGGHRNAATAVQSAIEAGHRGWNVRLVNLQEVLNPLDVFRKLTRVRLEDIYNLMLAKGWTLGSRQLLPLMHAVIRMYHPAQVKLLTGYWQQRRPDMVVSFVPNFNRALCESLSAALPGVPFVTIITDLADYPPHFWIEEQPQYFVSGSRRGVEQAVQMGHPTSRVFRVSGMILRPHFYEAHTVDPDEGRRTLGLNPDLPTGLVLFGGQGSNVMYPIAKRLGNSRLNLQLIMICGRNTTLRARLHRLKTRNKIFVEGFTNQIPYYMRLSDFFVGKPGPASISEALHMNLPVIVECNARTLPQECYNAEWIRKQGVGIVLKSFRRVETGVTKLLENLDGFKNNISRLENRALFEIPPILERILRDGTDAPRPAA